MKIIKTFQLNRSYIYLLSRLGAAALNLFSIALFTRYLETDLYGHYLLYIAYISMGSSIFFWWHRQSTYRYYNKFIDKYDAFIKTSYYIYFFICLIFIIICISISLIDIFSISQILFLLSVIGVIVKSKYDLCQSLFNIGLRDNIFGINLLIRSILFIIAGLVLIINFEIDKFALIFASIFSYFTIIVYSNYFILTNISNVQFDFHISKKIIHYGMPLVAVFTFDFILTFSDRIIIDYYLGSGSVGHYGVNYDLVKQLILFFMVIQSQIIYPKINYYYENNDKFLLQNIFKLNFNIFIIAFIPLSTFIIYFNKSISNIFIGSGYIEFSYQLIPVFVIIFLFWGFKIYHFDYYFHLKEKTRYQMYILFFGSIINLLMNFIFIPYWGILGAAYSTLFSYIIIFFISFFISRKLIKIDINKFIIVKTCLIITSILFFINFPLVNQLPSLLKMLIFLIIYLYLTNKYNLKEIRKYYIATIK